VSVIIYGVRSYGRVDAHEGEYAETRFFHIWFAPIVPVGSQWISPMGGSHSIKPNVKSIAAAYLRIWGAVAAVGLFTAGMQQLGVKSLAATGMLVTAACLGALSIWSWTWRNLRRAAHRRSDFNFVAFGTRCEPARRFAADRSELKRNLDHRWNERAPSQSPNEVAAHGAADAGEAVVAYGLLRLSAIERGKEGAADGADAERILEGKHTSPSVDDGPYRAGAASAADAKTTTGLAELVNQRAAATAAEALPLTTVDREWELRRLKRRSRLQGFGLVFMTFVAFGGVALFVKALQPTLAITMKDLRSANPPKTRVVTLTCDAVEPPLWEEYDKGGATTARIAMCQVGRYYVPIKLAGSGAVPARTVTGKLYEITGRELWVRQGLKKEPALEAQTTDLFIDATRDSEELGVGIFGLAMTLVTPVLWVLWFRARRRRKAAERELAAA